MDPFQPPGTILVPSTAAAAAAAAGREAPATDLSSDFETFLKMLATQLRNQDPLNPVESTDYAVQLATFSSVEQQVLTNQLLKGLASTQGVAGISNYASWIGLEARAPAPTYFDGTTPVELTHRPQAGADQAVLVVRNDTGGSIARLPVALDDDALTWAGATQNGNQVSKGRYTFELESYSGGELLGTDTLETYSRVTEARSENGEIVLVLRGGGEVQAASVTGLRSPT